MGEKTKKTQSNSAVIEDADSMAPDDGWVSPDVLAAQAGETVDFSMHVVTDDEEPDTDA